MENENIVKATCKELGITQKELAAVMSIHEETVSKWARNTVDVPHWALKHFELLKTERKYKTIKKMIEENQL